MQTTTKHKFCLHCKNQMRDLPAQIVLLNGETSDKQVDPNTEAVKLTTAHQSKDLVESDRISIIANLPRPPETCVLEAAQPHSMNSKKPVTMKGPQLAFKLKTLFMGSDGTVPEQYARTTEKKHLNAWLAEGLIAHRPSEKIYALTPKGENSIR